MKISKKIIFNYLCGNDIEEYDLEELENNTEFMLEVMKYSKDKNMYDLCSVEVKKDYKFVKGLINIFNNDIDFLKQVVDFYLDDDTRDDMNFENIEIIILMSNLLNEDNFDELEDYAFQALIFYENLLTSLDIYKKYYNDELGFDFLREWVNDNKVIVDFIAKNMTEKIFYQNDNMNFESLIHKYYKSGRVTKESGVRNFIISYISLFDNDLSTYISCNLDIIKDIEKDISVLECNWQGYIDSTNQKKIEILYQEVNNIIQDNYFNVRFTSYEVVMYVIKILHLEDIFNKYDIYDTVLDDEYIDICNMKMNKSELKCLNKIISFARKLFAEDVIDKTRNDYDNKYNEFKILKFDSKIRERKVQKRK